LARPLKLGLDYFPLDVNIDDDIELLEAECGLVGFAILVKLWQKIFSNSYYIEWNDDVATLFSRKINSGVNEVNSVVNASLRRNLFDSKLYEQYGILTSRGIQKRYLIACSQSKRKHIPMDTRFLLVNSEFTKFITELTGVSSGINTQKKGKESIYDDDVEEAPVEEVIPVEEKNEVCLNLKRITNLYEKNIGKVNDFVVDELKNISDSYPIELTEEAFKIAGINHAKNINYVSTILSNWKGKNITSLEQLKAFETEKKNKEQKNTHKKVSANSKPQKTKFHLANSRGDKYSADELEQLVLNKTRKVGGSLGP